MSREVPGQRGGLATPSLPSSLPSPACHHLGTRPRSSELAVAGWLASPALQSAEAPAATAITDQAPSLQPALIPQQRKKLGGGRGQHVKGM